jgi:hypothetical protein
MGRREMSQVWMMVVVLVVVVIRVEMLLHHESRMAGSMHTVNRPRTEVHRHPTCNADNAKGT